jgi:hypothetical protein
MESARSCPSYRPGLEKGQSDYQVSVAPADRVSMLDIPSREPSAEGFPFKAMLRTMTIASLCELPQQILACIRYRDERLLRRS